MPNPYSDEPVVYPFHLIEDGRSHLRLRSKLEIDKPIRLLNGIHDDEVPWQTALRIADCATSDDVRIHLIKNAGHRFSEPEQLAVLGQVTATLVAEIHASGD